MNKNKSVAADFVQFINSWKLQTALQQAEEEITPTRELLEKSLIENKPSEDYKEYLERVKKNINDVLGNKDDANSPPPKLQRHE